MSVRGLIYFLRFKNISNYGLTDIMRWGDLVSVNICILNEQQRGEKICFGRAGQNEEEKKHYVRGKMFSHSWKRMEKMNNWIKCALCFESWPFREDHSCLLKLISALISLYRHTCAHTHTHQSLSLKISRSIQRSIYKHPHTSEQTLPHTGQSLYNKQNTGLITSSPRVQTGYGITSVGE